MSAYANDPRVVDRTGRGELFSVSNRPEDEPVARVRRFLDGDTFVVWPIDETTKTEWREFDTADDAIRSLIGDPQ